MAYLNKVMIIGNVGNDPSIRVMPSGKKCATFSIATTRRYKDNNGETKELTDWHKVSAFGKTVDIIEQLHVSKGTQLYVEGTLANRSWDDPATGQKRSATEINLENFQLLSSRSNNGNGNGGNGSQQQQYGAQGNPYSRNNNSSPAQRQANNGWPPAGNQGDYPQGDADEYNLPF